MMARSVENSVALTTTQRSISALELAVGAAIVIGHNVFHLVPNEVPILAFLCVVSVRLREGSFHRLGLDRPHSWLRTVLIALVAAALVLAMGQFVTDPLAATLGLKSNSGGANALGPLKNHPWSAIKALGIVWTFAAFGEELGYRRYLLGRASDMLERSAVADWFGLVLVSILFGFGHTYQGPAGIFTTACDGFVIGAAYLMSGKNLWVAVLTHGLIDTTGIVLLYFGIAD
jgi:membrane protease YdiL (CAAX protease family)